MNLSEFKEYMGKRLDKSKFEEKMRYSIAEANKEVEEVKYRVKDKNISIIIRQNWDAILNVQHDRIKKILIDKNKENNYEEWERFISENEIIEVMNISFSEY